MKIRYTIVDCSLGKLLLGATERGVRAIKLASSIAQAKAALHREYPSAEIIADDRGLHRWASALFRYLQGQHSHLDLPLDIEGTAFQRRVWKELQKIPYGQTCSYSEIARKIGRPKAARAVARACATNPVPIVIPCHRVVREDGSLGGYGGGIARKRALLSLEGALPKLEAQRFGACRSLRKMLELQTRNLSAGNCYGTIPRERKQELFGVLREHSDPPKGALHMSQTFAIKTENLGRIYQVKRKRGEPGPKTLVALENVNVEVRQGELFGLLGPNGAGKTTLIKIVTTLLTPTSGRAFVDGIDVVENPQEVRRRINMVSGGETCGYGLLTVEENLWMFTQFYGLDSKTARERIQSMLEVVGLADRAKTKSYHLSTGMKQKMNFARGFLNDPKILFLDEPTLGLDVQTSRILRDFVKRWVRERPGKTILLTTHYMAEADELCDRVAIIDKGKILACDTPANLKRRLQGASIFKLQTTPLEALDGFGRLPGVSQFAGHRRNGHTELNFILEDENALVKVLDAVQAKGGHLLSLEKREPTLEDVFIHLVGRGLSDEENPT